MTTVAWLAAMTAAAVTLHVDQSVAPGGDGSAERPFTRVADALAAAPDGATLLIAAGLYEEALTTARPVTLEGVADHVVLAAPPSSAVAIAARATTTLRHLSIQGGRTGLLADADVTLDELALRGQPDVGVDCAGHRCALRRVQLEATFASAVGLRSAGQLELDRVTLAGPFKRGIEVESGGRVEGSDVTITGATTGVHSSGGEVDLTRLDVEDARQIGVFASAGRVRLADAVIARCGYGILARDGAQVVVRGAVAERCADADLASVGAAVEVDDWVSAGPTRDAAMTFDGGRAHVAHALIASPGPVGIRTHVAKADLQHITVTGAVTEGESFGNALFLQDSTARVLDLDGERLAGPAVEAQLGDSEVRDLTVVGATAAVDWEFRAHLDVAGLLQHGGTGTGLACIEGGRGQVLAARFEGLVNSPYLVDCSCHLRLSPQPADFPTCPEGTISTPGGRTIPGVRP